jgi:FOG: Glucan-binding domain (YG repeat)
MINRNKKVIATMITALAVVGIIPQGVHASELKTLKEISGDVNGAIAYKDGKYIVDVDNTEDEDAKYTGVVFVNGSSNKVLKDTDDEDLDTGVNATIYGDKYAKLNNGDYFVDLTSGDVTDDTIDEDNSDDASTALRKKLKKTDRYNESDQSPSLTLVKSNDFSAPYYSYNEEGFNGYTDKNGNYIDADYNTGNVYAIIGTEKKKFSNTDDKVTVGDKDYKLFVTAVKTLGQDKDNVYRLATLEVKVLDKNTNTWATPTEKVIINSIKEDGNVTTTGSAVTVTTDSQTSMKVIQKISKSQSSDEIDDAKYAKSVTSYELIGDADDKDAVSLYNDENVSFVDGKVISWSAEGGEVKVQVLQEKSKNGVTYFDEKTSDSEDFEALDVDVDGNLWRLDGGSVYKFDNDEDWTKVYKVDGSMDSLSVYNKDNLIVWSADDEIYAVASSASTGDTTTPTTPTNPTTPTDPTNPTTQIFGWVKNADGTWSYFKEGSVKATGWVKDTDGSWYFLKTDGSMATGWVNDKGTWYYLNPVSNGTMGAMKTGWVKDTDGTWYFLNADGSMAHDTTVDGYQLASNGAWVQ